MSQTPERWPVLVLLKKYDRILIANGPEYFGRIEDEGKGWQYIDVLPEEPVKTQDQIDYEGWKQFCVICNGRPEAPEAWCGALKWERSRGMPAPKPVLDEAAIRADERAKFKARIKEMWESRKKISINEYADLLVLEGRLNCAGFLRELSDELKEDGK